MLQTYSFFNRLESQLKKASTWLDIAPRQVSLLILSLPLALLVPFAAGEKYRMVSPVIAICAWLLSIVMVLSGGYSYKSTPIRTTKSTLVWAGILAIFAFLVRGLATDRYPILLTGDEGTAGIEATRFVNGEWNNIFIVGKAIFPFPALFHFIQSLSIRIFGQTTEALRIPSAIIGALTVSVLYLVGKKMFNPRAGLLAALSLATLHLHIHFSRIGLNNIWDGFWYVTVVGALWVGWQYEDRRGYMLAGVGLGLSQYFYPTSRALFVLLLLSLALAYLLDRQKFRRALPHLLVMILITLVIFLPLGWYYAKFPVKYIYPLKRVSIFHGWLNNQTIETGLPAWRILVTQISTGLQAYTFTPIIAWYLPEIPVLKPLAAAFFYNGLLLLVFRYRDGRIALLALWLIIIGLIGGLSESTPAAQRYVAAAPACSLLVGVGLDGSTRALANMMPKAARYFSVLAFVIIAGMMTNDLYFYFVKYTQKSLVDNTLTNGMVAQRMADKFGDQPSGTQVFFFGVPRMGFYSIGSTPYLAPQVTGIDINESWNALSEKPGILSDPAFFVFLPEQESEISAVQADYPGGTLTAELAWNNEVLYWIYELHANP